MNILHVAKQGISGLWRKPSSKRRTRRVAIFSPTDGLSKLVKASFIERLTQVSSEPVSLFSVDSNSTWAQLSYDLDYISREKFDVLFTIGTSSTKTALKYFNQANSSMPIVCSGIPQDMFSKSTRPKNLIGTTCHQEDVKPKFLEQFLKLKPNTRHVLFLYDFNYKQYSEQNRSLLEQVCTRNRKHFSTFNTQNLKAKSLASFLQTSFPKIDAVVLSRNLKTLLKVQDIADVCNALHVPLISFDANSVKLGASFGYDLCDENYGYNAADKVDKLLHTGLQNPEVATLTPAEMRYKILLNSQTMYKQNLDLDLNILLAMKHMEIA